MTKVLAFLLACWSVSLSAQDIQWASRLIKYSSQYSATSYSARQVLGRPNVIPPNYGASQVAWAPVREDNNGLDHVWVAFDRPMQVQQIAIVENLNPGSIFKIILYDTRGRAHTVYENRNPTAVMMPGRIFRQYIDRTDYQVESLRLEIKTNAVPGMNQIDAIAIADTREPIEAVINTMAYLEEPGNPENLGPAINSRFEDRLPIISPDGRTLYFARKEQLDASGQYLSDEIFFSTLMPGNLWSQAVNIGDPLNNQFHNYVVAVSADGDRLVLANEYNRLGSEGVSISTRRGDRWRSPEALRIKSMYNKNEFSCYHMNVDEDVILLAIEQDDTYGDMDIYVSFLEEGNKWSAPMNLGPVVNTAGIEGSAFLAADGVTVYFSSNGHAGYGGMDMFMTRRLDDTWQHWSEPVNLGPRINSRQQEYNYTIPARGDYAYFSSSNSIYGAADLYRIPLPREVQPLPVALLQSQFIDAITGEPLEVTLRVTSGNVLLEETPAAEEKQVKGKFGLVIPRRPDFGVVAEVPGYYPSNPVPDEAPTDDDMYMDFDEDDDFQTLLRDAKERVYEDIHDKELNPLDPKDMELLDEVIQRALDRTLQGRRVRPEERRQMEDAITEDVQASLKQPEQTYVEVTEDIEMVPLREGQIIRVNNIYFAANKSFLLQESFAELERIATFLRQNPNIVVEIGGHTNGLPSDEFCNELSSDRAERVYQHLVEQGIPADRLRWKGYGKTQPIADNATLAGRKKNQRVELKIIEVR